MELLAPAGNRDALIAAVQNGADAVYLGYTAFGARSFAGNFDADALREAVDYCHLRGRRVYVTVNTLIKQQELSAMYNVLALLCDVQADAAIVQDAGVAALAKACFPDLPLHASTQMALHNAQGARWAQSMGISRLVAARECPAAELRAIADTGLELEAFVHGALCVSVSGQCLLSSLAGGRSGNRGKCAQPCRQQYCLAGKEGYLLSPRDLKLLDELPLLIASGVTSLKIEGRMKRPEYVAVVTAAYRRALDAALAGAAYTPDEAQEYALQQVFHRGGFTKGYAAGDNHAALMFSERPSHGGIYMGKIEGFMGEIARMHPKRTLHNGDGLQVRGAEERDFTYAGLEIQPGGLAKLRVPPGTHEGDAIFRLTDSEQIINAQASWAWEHQVYPLQGVLTAVPGQQALLALTDGKFIGYALSEQAVQQAEQRPLSLATARAQIEKMGETPFVLDSLELNGHNVFMTLGALNALRRDALAALMGERVKRPLRRKLPPRQPDLPVSQQKPRLVAQTPHAAQAAALRQAGADVIYWAPDDYRLEALAAALAHLAEPAWFVLPQMAWTDELDAIAAWVRGHAARFSGVVLSNPGHLALDLGPLPRQADAPLHATNAWAASVWQAAGCIGSTVSPELNAGEMEELLAAGGAWEVPVYGRQQLMLLAHCPRLAQRGATRSDAACDLCDRGLPLPAIADRKGHTFPLRRLRLPHSCLVRLYNTLPTSLLKPKPVQRLRAMGGSWRLVFTDETLALATEITGHAKAALTADIFGELHIDSTAGHFARGVE